MNDAKVDAYFQSWIAREALAETMVPLIGRLYREQGVVITLCGRSLVHASTIEILKAHRFARLTLDNELSVVESQAMLLALSQLDLPSARIDIAKLTDRFEREGSGDINAFLRQALSGLSTDRPSARKRPQDVVLYGFGRIGRMLARILIERSGGSDKWRLRAVVVRPNDNLAKRASLLRRDSVHGPFKGTIILDEEENAIVANGNMIRFIHAEAPDQVDYTRYGIDQAIVLDNTGRWRDRDGLERHLASPGVAKVILTAPGEGDLPNIVYGVNNADIAPQERMFSAASCTTNAISPVLKVMHDRYGISDGHIETCHSYTNDQNLIDNYHKKSRRGRGAPLNMVITETGAAEAVAKILPALDGRLTANAIRVPTPNVSLAILNLGLERAATRAQINQYLNEVSLDSPLQGQIDFTRSPDVVSSDFVGQLKTAIVDSEATIVRGNRCVLYIWYDNEYGYSAQVIRILQHLAGLELPLFPTS